MERLIEQSIDERQTLQEEIAAMRSQLNLERKAHQKEATEQSSKLMAMRSEMTLGGVQIDEVAGVLNWPGLSDDVERRNGFSNLIALLMLFNEERDGLALSEAWKALCRKHLDLLLLHGYRNFKKTLALNYFHISRTAGRSATEGPRIPP